MMKKFNHKETAKEVKRELTHFELEQLKRYRVTAKDITKIYECEDSNWNLMLCKDEYFYSVPKNDKNCSISVYGKLAHVDQMYKLINI